MSQSYKDTTTDDLKPTVTVKSAQAPIHLVECAIQGTIYDLTIIPVKNFGNVGIGYNSGDAYLVINGLTRMSYVFGKGHYIALSYFAEKLFPRDYWSDADIRNVWLLYTKIVKEWFGDDRKPTEKEECSHLWLQWMHHDHAVKCLACGAEIPPEWDGWD